MKRILLLAILITTIVIGGTGCTFDNEPEQSVNELALEYLEEKYGEKFEYCAPAGSSYTGTRTFLATCESFGDYRVLVQIENFRDRENMVIRDNYIAVKYADKVGEFFSQIADEEFGSSKVFYHSTGRTLPPELPNNASLEEYFSCREGVVAGLIALPESAYKNDEQLSLLADKISDTFSFDELSVLIMVVDNDTFKSADEDELRDIFGSKSSVEQVRLNRYNGNTRLDTFEEDLDISNDEVTNIADITETA